MSSAYQFDLRVVLASLLATGVGILAVVFSVHFSILSPFLWLSRQTLSIAGVNCDGFGCFPIVLLLTTVYLATFGVLIGTGIVYAKQKLLD